MLYILTLTIEKNNIYKAYLSYVNFEHTVDYGRIFE